MSNIPSYRSYESAIKDFAIWQSNKEQDINILLIDYFQYLHNLKNEEGNNKYAPTTLRSKHSIFKLFWKMTGRGDLDYVCPIIDKNIKIWTKGYSVKKALAFTKDQLIQYHSIPHLHNPKYLTIKVYSIIAVSFAARSSEPHLINWEDVEKINDDYYKIRYHRVKQSTSTSNIANSVLIIGAREIRILDEYVSVFQRNERRGRFFRYLKLDRDYNIKATDNVIGKNPCQSFGKQMATQLGLPNATDYTGHCWRHTAITLCGDNNMSADNIAVNVSGKKLY
jgi:integrase